MPEVAEFTSAGPRGASPRYTHDCDHCTFVAWLGRYDVYHCPEMGAGTYVARFGDDGPEYTSDPDLIRLLNGIGGL